MLNEKDAPASSSTEHDGRVEHPAALVSSERMHDGDGHDWLEVRDRHDGARVEPSAYNSVSLNLMYQHEGSLKIREDGDRAHT